MTWVFDHLDLIFERTGQHLVISLIPVLLGLIVSVPLGWVANRWSVVRAIIVPLASILYTIPSLVLFVFLPALLGTKILDPINVIIPLTIYTVALLVRSVADALAAVPPHVIAAANAMGYRPVRRFFGVELPLAVPVLVAGLRVATVSNISLASVGAIIGVQQLGSLLTDGFGTENYPEIIAAILLIFILALIFDGLLLLIGKLATPWTRVTGAVK